MIITPSYTMTKVSGTTIYDANDLIANHATAASVIPFSFDVSKHGGSYGKIRVVRLFKDAETTTAASFKVHLFSATPVPTNGDNGAYAVSTVANYLGGIAIDMSSGATATTTDLWKVAAPSPEINFDVGGGKLYGLLQAIGGYTPITLEQFTVTLEIEKV